MAGHSSGLNLYWDPLNGGPTTDAWIAQTMSRIGRVYRIILREEAEAKKNKRKRDQEDLEEERQKGDGKGDSKGGGKDKGDGKGDLNEPVENVESDGWSTKAGRYVREAYSGMYDKGGGKRDRKGGGKDSEVDIKGDSSKGGGKGVSKGGDSVVDYEELWELI